MKKINLNNYHPILDIEDNAIFASNENFILAYRIALPEIYSLSEKDFSDIHGYWFQAMKSLPSGTIIQKQDIYQKTKFKGEKLPKKTFLADATYHYFKDREYLSHDSYLFFVLPENKAQNTNKYTNPFIRVQDKEVQQNSVKIKDFRTAVTDAVTYINNSRILQLTALDKRQIEDLTTSFFNGFQKDCTTDIELNNEGIQIGKNHFEVLAINSEKCFGDQVQTSKINERFTSDDFIFHQGFIDDLGLQLHENHMVSQIIYLDDKHKWRKLLEKKMESLKKSSNFGTQNKVVLEKITAIVDQINKDESARIVRGHLNVVYWSDKQTDLEAIATKIKAAFKEMDMLPYAPSSKERILYFLNSYPCFVSHFCDEDLYVSDLKHALCMWINNSNYQSDQKGVIFQDRQFNIPVLKDVWDEHKQRIKARNFAIFAPTGEGKSFLANNILRQFFEEGLRLVIIDLGGSYSKFAKLYPDQHIILRYEKGKNLGINPFYIEKDADLTPERLEDLTFFLIELLAENSQASKAKEVALKKVILAYYKKERKKHSLYGLYNYVKENKESILRELDLPESHFSPKDFLHILSEYVPEGIYSFLFDVVDDQSYKIEDKRLIIFELDEVRDNKEILSVMLKLIKSAIQRTIWQNKKERGIILFDEFAKQLKFGNVLESVEFYYQAIRKQNGAIGIILQSINQLPQNATAASILENTQVIYSLNNEKGYAELHKRLHLTSHDLNQLKSIRNNFTGERKYTEIFIKIGKQSNIFRLEVPPEVFAAYLTDGKESEAILKLYQELGDMQQAITTFIGK